MNNFTAQLLENPGEPYDFFAFLMHKIELVSPYMSEFIASTLPAFVQNNLPAARVYLIGLTILLALTVFLVVYRLSRVMHNHRKVNLSHFLGLGNPKDDK